METKFTKGEWKVKPYIEPMPMLSDTYIEMNNNNSALVFGNDDESIANAKLIVAAPEMFNELVILKEQVNRVSTGYPPVDYQLEMWIKRINEIIKKITV